MKILITALILLSTMSLPALALEPMSEDELKNLTGQIGTAAEVAGDVSKPAGMGAVCISYIASALDHSENLSSLTGPVAIAQTAAEPVNVITQASGDANSFRAGVTLGFF